MNAQALHGDEAAHMAVMQRRMVLDSRFRAGIGWFYWIAGLSLVNTLAYLFGTTWTFIAGLGLTQIVDAIMSLLVRDLGDSWAFLRLVGLGIDVLIAAGFVLIGYVGRKGHRWPVIAGMVLYTLDGLLLLVFKDIIAAAFHGWALYGIWTGLKAMRDLKVSVNDIPPASSGTPVQATPQPAQAAGPEQKTAAPAPNERLEQLDRAYALFVVTVNSLSPETFLSSLGDWTPRDIVAHLIGWNHNILIGCQQIRDGVSPFYHKDGPNDYRQMNAVSIRRYNSTDRRALLKELADTKDALVAYVSGLDAGDWDKDFGPKHYRGGPATVARSIESLTGDYLNHAQELVKAVR